MKKMIKREYTVVVCKYTYLGSDYLESCKQIVEERVLNKFKKRSDADRCYEQAVNKYFVPGSEIDERYYPNTRIILKDSQGRYVKWVD